MYRGALHTHSTRHGDSAQTGEVQVAPGEDDTHAHPPRGACHTQHQHRNIHITSSSSSNIITSSDALSSSPTLRRRLTLQHTRQAVKTTLCTTNFGLSFDNLRPSTPLNTVVTTNHDFNTVINNFRKKHNPAHLLARQLKKTRRFSFLL